MSAEEFLQLLKKNSLNIVVKCAYLGNDFIEYDRTFLKLIQLARDKCKRLEITSMRVVCLKKNGRILCSQLLGKICNRNSNEWSLIWSVIIRVITESDDRACLCRVLQTEVDDMMKVGELTTEVPL